MALPRLKFRNAIVCEHLASGGNNKTTLINVFSGDIIVASMPANLMLAFYIELVRQEEQPSAITLELRLDKKVAATFNLEGDTGEVGSIGAIPIPSGMVHLETNVLLTIWAKAKGFRDTLVLSSKVYQGQIPPPT